jgi:hypothetical protein
VEGKGREAGRNTQTLYGHTNKKKYKKLKKLKRIVSVTVMQNDSLQGGEK